MHERLRRAEQRPPDLIDADVLLGRATYGDDLRFEGLLHAAFVRSPHAHGRIARLDVERARRRPGILAVLTGADFSDVKPLPFHSTVPGPDGGRVRAPNLFPLARDTVRYCGEPVAMIVAESRAQALDAAEDIEIGYEVAPAITEARAAATSTAPLVDAELGSNIIAEYRLGDVAAAEKAFQTAAVHVRLRVRNNRIAAAPMEPRVSTASYDAETSRFILHAGVQAPHLSRQILAEALGIDPAKLRVVVPRMGGGFGARIAPYREDLALLLAARRIGRPVRWRAERSELFFSDLHARDHDTDIEGAFDESGVLLAVRTRVFANLGAYPAYFGIPIATTTGNRIVDGPYRVPVTDLTVHCVLTHTVPTGPYRGAGRPEVVHRLERLMDRAAQRFGIDPVEIRRRNLIDGSRIPYRNNAGQSYDSGNFPALLERALEISDWSGFEARRQRTEAEGRLRGRGMCYHIDTTSGMTPSETVVARSTSGGVIELLSGTQEMGQSIAASYRMIAAAELGIDPQRIRVLQGDTDSVATGAGSYGSRSLYIGGSAVLETVRAMKARMLDWASGRLEVAPQDLEINDDGFRVVGSDRFVGWQEALRDPEFTKIQCAQGFGADFNFPNGCYVAEVEIDRETGAVFVDRLVAVDDVGRVLNPAAVKGQVQGGVAQGLGQAVMEACVYNAPDGQLLSGSFMDYALPRASDMPELTVVEDERWPSPTNPLGAKGAGESGAVGTPPAVVSAVLDALRPYGDIELDMPIRSEDVWRVTHGHRDHRHPLDQKPHDPALKTPGSVRPISGEFQIDAPREKVWDALFDPEVLKKVIPGAEHVERVSPDCFRGTVSIGFGPVRARLSGTVRIKDARPPASCVLVAESSAGEMGSVSGRALVRLQSSASGTTLVYESHPEIRGRLAAIGQRFITAAADRLSQQFFSRFVDELGATDAAAVPHRGRHGVPAAAVLLLATVGLAVYGLLSLFG